MNKSDICLLRKALRSNKQNKVFAYILLDLPESNGQILFAIYRDNRQQLTAVLKPHKTLWDPDDIRQENEVMVLPDWVYRLLKKRLRVFNILHILGVQSEDKIPQGVLLTDETLQAINLSSITH